jgi:predicted lipoprotein with Yx(FWY)xxD motif
MRKSGWAAAAGLVAAALLLTACGGSSSSSTTAATGGSTPSTGAASTSTPNPHASSVMSSPPAGAIYFGVSRSTKGWSMAEGNGSVVYTYAGDSAGKAPTCTGACAALWLPVKGVGLTSLADHTLPGQFGVVGGVVTYNGLPLYTYKGELPYMNHAGGQWKSVSLSPSLIISG